MSAQPETLAAPSFLRRVDAAQYLQNQFGLRCAKQTLAKLAVIGGGPRYHLGGRTPLYAPADLDRWAKSKISGPRLSTSQKVVQPPPLSRPDYRAFEAHRRSNLAE
jgi:hypothetical protein